MKVIILAFLMVFTVVHGISRSESVQDDFRDFMELIPIEKIKKIAIQHLHDDPKFQAAIGYMQSPDWKNMTEEFVAQPEVQKLVQFLKEAGLDLEILSAGVCKFIMDAKVPVSDFKARSLSKFIHDVQEIIPMVALIDMLDDKLNNSPHFKEFYNKISSDDAYLLVSKVTALPSFKNLVDELRIMGINVNQILSVLYAAFGWNHKYNSFDVSN